MELIITAYPKSGITWFVHLLSDVLDLTQHDDPNAGAQGYWGLAGDKGIIRKVHQPNVNQFDDKQVIMLQRDPRDVMISAMYYRNHFDFDSALRALATPTMHEVGGEWKYEDYINSWLSTLNTRYEYLHSKPVGELSRLFRDLGVEVPEAKIQAAIDRQSFDNMRQAINNDHFMRLGKVGDWRNHFTKEQGRAFNEVLGEFMLKQGYVDNLDWWQEID